MADNVIKEFLVSLGFKVDDKSQKSFNDGIDLATAKAVALGEGMVEAAKAVASAVTSMAQDLDTLYWRTQRLGSSAVDVKAFEYAISQLGGSAQGARASLENIAEFLKSSPGNVDFLLQYGVSPEHIGNAEKSLIDLEKTFKRMPYWQAKSIASVIGIDPLTLQAMIRDTGEFEKQLEEMAKASGLNFDEAAKKAAEFQQRLRELREQANTVFEAAQFDVLKWLLPKLNELAQIIENINKGKNLTGIARDVRDLADGVGVLRKAIDDLNKAFGDLSTGSGIGNFISGVTRGFADIFKSVGYLIEVVADIKNGDFAKAKKDWWASSIAMNNLAADVVQAGRELLPSFMRPDNLTRYAIPGESTPGASGNGGTPGGAAANPNTRVSRRRGSGTRAERNNNPGNLEDGPFARRQPGYVGSDGRFAVFTDVTSGLNAMANLLRSYMAKGRDTIAEIISKWAPSSENNVGAYVTHVEQLTGIGRFDQLQMSDIQRVAAAMAQHEGFRGLGVSGAGRSATVNQTNNYSISSNQDPKAIAHEIAASQHDVNQRLVANFGLIVQ